MKKTKVNMTQLMKSDFGRFVLRFGLSLIMIFQHGLPKLIKLFGDKEISFVDPIGIGVLASFLLVVFAEFLCSIAMLLGLWTRWAAIILAINMFVAVFVQLEGMSFADLPKQSAALFLIGYVAIAFLGGGRFSIDKFLRSKKRQKSIFK